MLGYIPAISRVTALEILVALLVVGVGLVATGDVGPCLILLAIAASVTVSMLRAELTDVEAIANAILALLRETVRMLLARTSISKVDCDRCRSAALRSHLLMRYG